MSSAFLRLPKYEAVGHLHLSKLSGKRGSVAAIRRRQIVDKINASMGWKLV